jgi:pimeloyl-ACP methyl ester carboxylesterase
MRRAWLAFALALAHALAPSPAAAAPPRWAKVPLPPPMPEPAASGRVARPDGAQIYYAVYGQAEAPPVILLHGGLGNGDHFANLVPALRAYRAIAIDSRGQGRSTLAGKLSYRGMAADVLAVMDALRIPRASFVGWSDGGAIALALAVDAADRVDRVIVIGTNYDRTGLRRGGGGSATFAAYSAKCRADFARLARPKAYEAAAAALAPVWRDPAPFTREQLKSIRARTLAIGADRDELVLPDHVKELAALIPDGESVILRDTSHFAMWQDPAAFNQLVVSFLGAR